jgi:Fur family ferric uptake transcriptional regulator
VEVSGKHVEAWAAEVATRHGFSDVNHTIELFGTCADCA